MGPRGFTTTVVEIVLLSHGITEISGYGYLLLTVLFARLTDSSFSGPSSWWSRSRRGQPKTTTSVRNTAENFDALPPEK